MSTAPKLLILGIDGADPDIISGLMDNGAMPHLAAISAQGVLRPLRSTLPPTTFPAWTSFLTGTTPSWHGVTDFTVKKGYRIQFTGASDRQVPTVFEHLEEQGLRCGVAWFPATYPPLPLRGYQVSGWDSPVTTQGNASFVHPPALHDELTEEFGDIHLQFDAINEYDDSPDWYRTAARQLVARVARRGEMAQWLTAHHPVDVAAFYFGETDTVAHHFYAFHDPGSPRRPVDFDPALATAVTDVYKAVDQVIGQFRQRFPDTPILIVSDHGSAGNSATAVYLNRFLEKAGLLRFKNSTGPLPRIATRDLPARLVPASLRRSAFRLMGGLLPSLYESQLRFKGIDFTRTLAFSEEVPYAPSIWLNQRGREPAGIVAHRDRNQVSERLKEAAASFVYGDGTPVVEHIHPREELHDGPLLHLFPDFVLELNRVGGYMPVCLSSAGIPGEPSATMGASMLLGRKGRSMPGGHARDGIFACNRPATGTPDGDPLHIHQTASLVCELLEVPAMVDRGTKPHNPVSFKRENHYTAREQMVVARRLKRLGYLED